MNRIMVVFGHAASREKISGLVVQLGHEVWGSYRSGAEVLRAVDQTGSAIIVSGYKLADMTVDRLAQDLEGRAHIIVAASPINLELIETPGLIKIPSPISRTNFRTALEGLLELPEDTAKQKAPRTRSPEELRLIETAKDYLIRSGMSEAEAHSFLQQRSMQNRCKMVDTARRIIEFKLS